MRKFIGLLCGIALLVSPAFAYNELNSSSDPAGAAATVKSYFTSQNGYLTCNGTSCTATTATASVPGQVSGLVYNNTSSAAANSAAINSALAVGGSVSVNCPAATPIFYISSTLVIGSHTTLHLANCTPTLAASSNQPVIVNRAYTQPWAFINQGANNITWASNSPNPPSQSGNSLAATLFWPNHGLSIGSWVQLGPMSDNPPWIAGSYYDVGVTSVANGNKYTVVTAGTAAATGTGPSGTGTSISDGTVVWSYVAAYGSPASYFWSGTATAPAQGGLMDTAYAGVFYVASVTDSNNVVIILRRRPNSAFSGVPIMVRAADHDVEIDGGGSTIDCNGANQTSTLTSQKVCVMQVGVARAKYHDFAIKNMRKWAFSIEGGANIDLENVDGSPETTYIGANQNQFMDYGCFDCTVGYVRGWGFDDSVAIQTSNAEQAAHYDELFMPGQDVLGFHAHHIRTEGGMSALSIWNLHNTFIMDDITLDHAANHSNFSTAPAIRFQLATSAIVATGGTVSSIGSIKISDTESRDPSFFFQQGGTYGNVVVNNLTFDNVSMVTSSTLMTVNPPAGTAITFKNITVQNSSIYNPGNVLGLSATTTGTLSTPSINFSHNSVTGQSGNNGNIVNIGGTNVTAGTINIDDNQLTNISYLTISTAPAVINVNNNVITNGVHGVRVDVAGQTENFCGNSAYNVGGLVYFNTAVATTINSCGSNTLSGGTTWINYNVAGTPTVHGWDVSCDVTKLSRTTGEYCLNTNTAPGSGTLNAAGPVMDQGTSANSWFLMSNPSGQQY